MIIYLILPELILILIIIVVQWKLKPPLHREWQQFGNEKFYLLELFGVGGDVDFHFHDEN